MLNPHQSGHSSTSFGILRKITVRLQNLHRVQRSVYETDSARQIVTHLLGPDAERERRVWDLLVRRARCWGDDAEEIFDGTIRFAKDLPPIEIVVVVFTSLLYAWCTTARFNHQVVECWFCGEADADYRRHYLNCTVLWRWLHDRLFYGVIAEDGMAFFLWRSKRGEVALAFSARGGGSLEFVSHLLYARFKRARRRHRAVRALLYGVPGVE